jgi:hypothetical protein
MLDLGHKEAASAAALLTGRWHRRTSGGPTMSLLGRGSIATGRGRGRRSADGDSEVKGPNIVRVG